MHLAINNRLFLLFILLSPYREVTKHIDKGAKKGITCFAHLTFLNIADTLKQTTKQGND